MLSFKILVAKINFGIKKGFIKLKYNWDGELESPIALHKK